MANRQARRAAAKVAARFNPRSASVQPVRKLHPGLLPRTRDFNEWLTYVGRVYGGAR